MYMAIWLLPILFMLHDFEEIIMIGAWKKRNKLTNSNNQSNEKDFLSTKVPYSDFKSTASFSIGVAVEFLLFSAVSLMAFFLDNYYIWFIFMFAVTFHYLVHLKMCISFKGYVPGIATSVICFPISIILLIYVSKEAAFSIYAVIIFCLVGVLAGILIVKTLHTCMERFDKWLKDFSDYK